MAKVIDFPKNGAKKEVNSGVCPDWTNPNIVAIPTDFMDIYHRCEKEVAEGMAAIEIMMREGTLDWAA